MGEVLTPREEAILLGLLDEHRRSGEPVSSRALAELSREPISPATVRNILGRLEDSGYLRQPHASSGRVPTDEAYRYVAERVRSRSAEMDEPDPSEVERLASDGSLNAVAMELSNSLARTMRSLGFAVTPPLEEVRLRSCDLVHLGSDRVLCVVVSMAGQVHQQVLRSPEAYTPEQLRWFSAYLNETYRGMTFSEIRQHLRVQVEGERTLCGQKMDQALRLVAPYFRRPEGGRELFWDGASWLLCASGLRNDLDGVRSLLESLQQKSRLLELLETLVKESDPLRIVLGDDWPDPSVRGLAMVASAYGAADRGYGIVGVIGPKSLPYDEAIPVVRHAARLATLASGRL
jgi:heat-inducible transcriptional repressor